MFRQCIWFSVWSSSILLKYMEANLPLWMYDVLIFIKAKLEHWYVVVLPQAWNHESYFFFDAQLLGYGRASHLAACSLLGKWNKLQFYSARSFSKLKRLFIDYEVELMLANICTAILQTFSQSLMLCIPTEFSPQFPIILIMIYS